MPDENDNSEESMIFGSEAVSVSHGADATIEHFENGEKNESTECIFGSPGALRSMETDAKRFGHAYFAMCFIANPSKLTTREQFMATIFPEAANIKRLPMAEATVYEHVLSLKGGVSHRHWHIAWGYADPLTGKVRDWGWDRIVNERVGRTLDIRLQEPIVLGRFQDRVIEQMQDDGEHAMAATVAAAHPPGAKPNGRTAKRAIEQAAKARGINLRDINDKVGTAYCAATNLDAFRTELAACGLSLEISHRVPNRPAWVIHQQGRFVRSLCGALPRVSLATIVAKIGEPNDERTSPNERPKDAARAGSLSDKTGLDRGHDGGAGHVQPGTERADDDDASEIFISALQEVNPSVIDNLYRRALHFTRGALVKALEYLSNAQAKARAFLATAADARPAPSATLVNFRREIALLSANENAAYNAWGDSKMKLLMLRHDARPTPVNVKIHDGRIKRTEAEIEARKAAFDAAKHEASACRKLAEQFEDAYRADIVRFQATIVAKQVSGARRWLRAAARCSALIDASPVFLTFGAPALFARAVGEDERAKPGASFVVAGPDQPEIDHPEEVPGWKR